MELAVSHDLQEGEAVGGLPEDVGEEEERGEKGRDGRKDGAKGPPRRGGEEAYEEREPDGGGAVLHEDREAEEAQGGDEEPGVLALGEPEEQEHRREHEQRLEGVHGEQVARAEEQRAGEGRGGGQGGGGTAPGEPGGEAPRKVDRGGSGEPGEEPQSRQVGAEERPGEPGQQSDPRRLVHVSGLEPLPADQEVELVAEEPVAAHAEGVKAQGGEGEEGGAEAGQPRFFWRVGLPHEAEG